MLLLARDFPMGLPRWATLAQGLPIVFTEALLCSLGCFPPTFFLLFTPVTIQEGIKRLGDVGMLERLCY